MTTIRQWYSKVLLNQERLIAALSWVGMALPFGIYAYFAFRYSANIPYQDDYETFLSFPIHFLTTVSWLDRVKLLFSQLNEHRVIIPRLVILADYYLQHRVDLKVLTLLADLGWMLAVGLLIVYCYRAFKLPALLLIPLPYILLSFGQYENMFWASSALLFNLVLLGCLLVLLCLATDRFTLATLLFPVALFTHGASLILYPVGNLYLMSRRQWKEFWIFFITSTLWVVLYFYHYQSSSFLVNRSFTDIGAIINYFFAFLGNIVAPPEISLLLGFVLFACLAVILVLQPEQKLLVLLAAFVLGEALVAAVTRSPAGAVQAHSPRYASFTLLGWGCVYIFIVTWFSKPPIQLRLAIGASVMAVAFFGGILTQYVVTGFFEELYALKESQLTSYAQTGDQADLLYVYPNVAAWALDNSEKLGIYNYQNHDQK